MGKFVTQLAVVSAAAFFTLGGGGCVERRVKVTSEPSGARVWLNDEVIGETPCEAGFRFYGKYDVRLTLDGYEPVHEGRVMRAPVYEYPIVDLVAEALPVDFESVNEWHFVLVESGELDGDREGLVGRALEMRGE